jgi:hypothetical protein
MSETERLRDVVAYQAAACAAAGSPLYEQVLVAVLGDFEDRGITYQLLHGRSSDPVGSALTLRLLGAVHRIVLEGRAESLAAHYPSVGGEPGLDAGAVFLETVREHWPEVDRRIEDGVQTNEVGRSAVLAGGYAAVARRTHLPLRVLEVGASAGLNLRFDEYCYLTGRRPCGPVDSPVRFEGVWEGDPPELPKRFEVAARRGCDRNPLDPTTREGRLTLLSYVWPDQIHRIDRLSAALEVARRVPVVIDDADAADWVEAQLATEVLGQATVVTHSIVFQYLPPDSRTKLERVLREAGEQATGAAPLAWLRMEPAGERAELRLTTWPHGDDVVLGTAGYHGSPIWWGAPG